MSDPMGFLLWVKGPAFNLAVAIFALGMLARIVEIFMLGRKANYAEPKRRRVGAGLQDHPHPHHRRPRDLRAGALRCDRRLGLAHRLHRRPAALHPPCGAVQEPAGVLLAGAAQPGGGCGHGHYPGRPDRRPGSSAVAPGEALISTLEDYLVWAVTFLLVLTGYLAYHRLVNPYPLALGLHILSAELFLVICPFTKLTHIFTAFIARWYNGASFGRKGVES